MSQTKKSNTKTLVLLLLALAVIAAFALSSMQKHKTSTPALPKQLNIDGTLLSTPRAIAPFTFTDNTGQPFTNKNLQGKWSMLFFGFTNCGYICPTTMSALDQMYKKLQTEMPAKQLPQVIMASVDPARDTVKRMDEYVKAFNPAFIGIRAPMAQTKALEKQFSVVAVKVKPKEGEKGQYTMSHSAGIMLIDPQGKLRAFLSFPHKGKQMAHDYRLILKTVA